MNEVQKERTVSQTRNYNGKNIMLSNIRTEEIHFTINGIKITEKKNLQSKIDQQRDPRTTTSIVFNLRTLSSNNAMAEL